MDDNAVIVADGGDFVGTASYIVRPRGPLSWLDPGMIGRGREGGGRGWRGRTEEREEMEGEMSTE